MTVSPPLPPPVFAHYINEGTTLIVEGNFDGRAERLALDVLPTNERLCEIIAQTFPYPAAIERG